MMRSILIVGGTRGIGASLVKFYAAKEFTTVFATSRSKTAPESPSGSNIKWLTGVDLMTPTCGTDMASQIPKDTKLSTMYISAGIFLKEDFDKGPDWDVEVKTYTTVSIAPPFLVHPLVKSKTLDEGSKLIIISTEGGSIKLRNDADFFFSHHGSKAALNAVGVQLALGLKSKGIAVGLVHPGFTRTEMTKGVGFDSAWDAGHALPPDETAKIVADWVDDKFDMDKTGQLWAPRGSIDIGSWEDVMGKAVEGPVQLPW